jgi:hypothetical protein
VTCITLAGRAFVCLLLIFHVFVCVLFLSTFVLLVCRLLAFVVIVAAYWVTFHSFCLLLSISCSLLDSSLFQHFTSCLLVISS